MLPLTVIMDRSLFNVPVFMVVPAYLFHLFSVFHKPKSLSWATRFGILKIHDFGFIYLLQLFIHRSH